MIETCCNNNIMQICTAEDSDLWKFYVVQRNGQNDIQTRPRYALPQLSKKDNK